MFRLRLEIYFKKDAFFFDRGYKINLSSYFREVIKNQFFVFSDIIPSKKKPAKDGFWALDRAALILNTAFQELLPDIALKIMNTPVDFRYGRLTFSKAIFQRVPLERTGYLLSPVAVALLAGENLLWEERPERFSEALRQMLVDKYIRLYGRRPSDDRFLFRFRGRPVKEELDSGVIAYRGKFEIFSSEELVMLSYLCGLGSFNAMGYGMASPDLYLWKKPETMEGI
ncbi:CRISPR-associated endoribonuclease Cas6 [Thermosediminibacter litoriperuensis]|uniref:CRISPR-associated endoribonuclease Cas6 n=1 Tax=Thermosediminibacter litoriperuensis TaxID=291989 RepID=A0A5S5ASL3_9FIRM|nr:CRISPR-associated endoribonuclease Cas6 [Thermosediminibacter litoriperuensis]TYP55427.1 CRISPR-associated endoribonuclease Cas6 [Thermosediminibacter litoriperuensis]